MANLNDKVTVIKQDGSRPERIKFEGNTYEKSDKYPEVGDILYNITRSPERTQLEDTFYKVGRIDDYVRVHDENGGLNGWTPGCQGEYFEIFKKVESKQFLRFKRDGLDVTKGKVYEVINVSSGGVYEIFDDVGDRHTWDDTNYFEVLTESDRKQAQPGDEILVANAVFNLSGYENGDVLTVGESDEDGVDTTTDNYLLHLEYIVLESATPKFKVGDKVQGLNTGTIYTLTERREDFDYDGFGFAWRHDQSFGWIGEDQVELVELAEEKPADAFKVGDKSVFTGRRYGTMSGFLAGDIVEIVENPFGESDPDYRVKRVTDGHTGYAPKKGGFLEPMPVKTEETTDTVEEGDIVRVVKSTGFVPVGAIGVVSEVRTNDFRVETFDHNRSNLHAEEDVELVAKAKDRKDV